ncbi:hypothetical protein BSKO_01177 [Bryopsis sp. KO-2023]|nr:hypothetical protein BSKO_01177 [Bryopsis sp. KO-2023]
MADYLDLRSALELLGQRHPALHDSQQFRALLVDKNPDWRSVNLLFQELFARPELTLSVCTAFRRVLMNLASSYADKAQQHPVDILSCLALAKAVVVAPHLNRVVLRFFQSQPCPLDIVQEPGDMSEVALTCLAAQDVVPDLCKVWNFNPWLKLLKNEDVMVRWCGIQAVSNLLGLSDLNKEKLSNLLLSEDQILECAMRWEKHREVFENEKTAMWISAPQAMGGVGKSADKDDMDVCENGASGALSIKDLASPVGYVKVRGLDLICRESEHLESISPQKQREWEMIVTPTVERNLQSAALALCQNCPLLLEGPPGSGKTSLIRELGNLTGNLDIVHVHIDDQTDAKSLLGAYVCTAVPGEFVWQPGPLTQAVSQGKWLAIEDINLAPPQVLASLIPLLESGKLAIPQRAEVIQAAPGLQILATVTCSPKGLTAGAYGNSDNVKEILGGLWSHVHVENPPPDEQLCILEGQFPELHHFLPFAMAVGHLVQSATGQGTKLDVDYVSQGRLDFVKLEEAVRVCLDSAGITGHDIKLHVGRNFSLRDLVKWCERMQVLHGEAVIRASKSIEDVDYGDVTRLPFDARQAALVESCDVFATMVHDREARRKLMNCLASIWGLGSHDVEVQQDLNKPSISVKSASISIGRVQLPMVSSELAAAFQRHKTSGMSTKPSDLYSHTGHAVRMMERVGASVRMGEATLLVGDTGTGKTALVQHIAEMVGAKLVVLNLSQQSDSSDLLGGFKPVSAKDSLLPLLPRFVELVRLTWTKGNNEVFVARLMKYAERGRWRNIEEAFEAALNKVKTAAGDLKQDVDQQEEQAMGGKVPVSGEKRKKQDMTSKPNKKVCPAFSPSLRRDWLQFEEDVVRASRLRQASETAFAFAFVEGVLLKALKQGWWLLLDEINLAPPEVLECLAGILDPGSSGSVTLAEKGSVMVERHANFRLIGAMNPATDAGKRDLPTSLRNRFTEFWYPEPESAEDLAMMATGYLSGLGSAVKMENVVAFYQTAKMEAEKSLLDGAGHKPAYNLRTLCRWLLYVRQMVGVYGLRRCFYDGAAMAFLTQLDPQSAPKMEEIICTMLLGGKGTKGLFRPPAEPQGGRHVLFEQFWVEVGNEELQSSDATLDSGGSKFILTDSIRGNLKNLARAVVLRRFPILLQGPTSSGKTSLVSYLAAQTGHRLIRINNHEHTDLQEYLGTYIADETGKLVFREGALVQAVRKGYWVVLDELNLAPTEVLEALNRLLDDNRELFIPETQETVKPHPQFMLFATQNPPGVYAGRKVLSRAFRSRFLELHVDDIPDGELATILEARCSIPPSYAAKLVSVMRELQRRRQSSNVFAGKHGFITPRDLFRWADREAISYEQLAENGFLILAERLRDPAEKATVKEVLEKIMRVKLDIDGLYEREGDVPMGRLRAALTKELGAGAQVNDALKGIVWTHSMKRMFALLDRCMEGKEPALLVGETGTGKTTVCQLLALMRGQKLHILNCNQHTETSDFLGGFRPTRDRERALGKFRASVDNVMASPLFDALGVEKPSFPDSLVGFDLVKEARKAQSSVSQLENALKLMEGKGAKKAAKKRELKKYRASLIAIQGLVADMVSAGTAARMPFVWVDGPLVEAMRNGDIILIDELNLAEDAVLERMNSVLETGRSVTLAEKGGEPPEVVTAAEGFRLFATMNPGGDYGKKELSPALSNRFTQIWVPPIEGESELLSIMEARLADEGAKASLPEQLISFWRFFRPLAAAMRTSLTVRDLLSWVGFINVVSPTVGLPVAFVHGIYLVLLDGVGLGTGGSTELAPEVRQRSREFLIKQMNGNVELVEEASGKVKGMQVTEHGTKWGISPFFIPRGPHGINVSLQVQSFNLEAPTPCRNVFRVLRAMQLRKSILMEGSPGVGKTSLVAAMARLSGHRLVRINLSEQTDMMDLLGADLPVPGGGPGEFRWCDGPLLGAIKAGDWVLLDELNLASQQVLEGLNAILDHRSEVFIPELGQTFQCPPTFRLFGAQNPLQEGGGRKGLPRSFLNRFTRVFIEALTVLDMKFIGGSLSPRLPRACLDNMVTLLNALHTEACVEHKMGGIGGPWEFNLRDLMRWCELVERRLPGNWTSESNPDNGGLLDLIEAHAQILFVHRFRTANDRKRVSELFRKIWGKGMRGGQPDIALSPTHLYVGGAVMERRKNGIVDKSASSIAGLQILSRHCQALECVATCVSHGWSCLLVGSSCSGKNSIVRVLAQLCGRPLVEIALTQGTDTSDLLGGFEQMEVERMVKEVCKSSKAVVYSVIDELVDSHMADASHLCAVQRILSAWGTYASFVARNHKLGSTATSKELLEELFVLQNVLGKVKAACSEVPCGISDKLGTLEDDIVELQSTCSNSVTSQSTAGRFEWVDGVLCRAMERGEWVLLDNANLCNPTVLDRLNSVLEPNGVLYLNECGGVGGEPRVIRPHPDFRLFLAYNPQHGEVSRAMRNRSMEIFVTPQATCDTENVSVKHDLNRILTSEGISASTVCNAMRAAHSELENAARLGSVQTPSVRDLKQWASLTHLLAVRGWPVNDALHSAWNQVYVRREPSVSGRTAALAILTENCLSGLKPAVDTWCEGGYECPPVASPLLGVDKQSSDSAISTIRRETSALQCIEAQVCAAEVSMLDKIDARVLSKRASQVVHKLPRLLQELSFTPGSEHAVEDWTGLQSAASEWLREQGTIDMFSAARLLIERFPAVKLASVQSWCSHELNHHKEAAENLGLEKTCQGVMALEVLSLVLMELIPKLPLMSKKLNVGRALAHRGSDMESLLPLGAFYGAALKRNKEQQDEDLWRQELHLVLIHLFSAALERLVQNYAETAQKPSPYQLSYQMFLRPEHRGSKEAVRHKILEWIYPIFSVVNELEKVALDRLFSGVEDISHSDLNKQVGMLQQWRSALWMCCHGGLSLTGGVSIDAVELEGLCYVWLKLRRTLQKMSEMDSLSDMQLNRIRLTVEGTNTALELPHERPAKPLLWEFSGHPDLPRSKDHSDALLKLYSICEELVLGPSGFAVDRSGKARVLAAAGVVPDNQEEEAENAMIVDGECGDGSDRASGECIAAALTCDRSLRRSLLQGVSMAASAVAEESGVKLEAMREISELVKKEIAAKCAYFQGLEKEGDLQVASPSGNQIGFNSSAMTSDVCRKYEEELLCLAQCQGSQEIRNFPSLTAKCLLEVVDAAKCGPSSGDWLDHLRSWISAAVEECGLPVLSLVPLQQLVWLGEAGQYESQWKCWIQEMWYRWQRSLWENALGEVPADVRFSLGSGVDIGSEAMDVWKLTAGPGRVYQATLSVYSPALVRHPPSIRDVPMKVEQLKMAARQLFRFCVPSGRLQTDQMMSRMWESIAILFAQIVLAHLPSIDDGKKGSIQQMMAAFLEWASNGTSESECWSDVESALATFKEIMQTSTHILFVQCLDTLVIPCFRLIIEKKCERESDVFKLGRAWVLLGSLRLHLVLPSPGLDPAGKTAHKISHIRSLIKQQIDPDLRVRNQLQQLPGGWDETMNIETLGRRKDSELVRIADLESQCVLRPTPPQYTQIQRELQRFMNSLGSISRIQPLVAGLQNRDANAVQQAYTWQDSARGLCERLSRDFPLYQDILQPVQCALLEVCHGFAAMAGVVQMNLASVDGPKIQGLVSGLLAFPEGAQAEEFVGLLSSPSLQKRCSDIIATAALKAESKSQVYRDHKSISYDVRIFALRTLLISASQKAMAPGAGTCKKAAIEDLETIFQTFLQLWEELRTHLESMAEEEAQMFKTKKKSTTFETDEARDEREYNEMFPSHSKAFDDIADLDKDEMPGEALIADDGVPADPDGVTDMEAATIGAQSLLEGEVVQEIVTIHRKVYAALGGREDSNETSTTGFKDRYDLGAALLASVGGVVGRHVDDQTATGHLVRVCMERNRLSESPTAGGEGEAVVSLRSETTSMKEVKLCREPMFAIQRKLVELLEQWPEHPVLAQLKEISERILSFPVTVPIKKVLVGLELLVARAQVWEESAAKHVSLEEQLKMVTGLANRWRRLELASWRTILADKVQEHARDAWKSWFHIYQLVLTHRKSGEAERGGLDGEGAGFATAMEQFVQTATLGEYTERLQLLSSFQDQLRMSSSDASARETSNILENLVVYYRQFEGAVHAKLQAGLAPIEKDLEGFVRLAKWEDRGYYAMRIGAERAQRKLHKLCQGAESILKMPAVMVLNAVQDSMGFRDLEAKHPDVGKEEEPVDGMETVIPLWESELRVAWGEFCQQLNPPVEDAPGNDMVMQSLDLDNKQMRYNQIPRLTVRMQKILGVIPAGVSSEGSDIDELAGAAASRALELKKDVTKAAKSRKKKALSDFFKSLAAIGASKRRSAIPKDEQDVMNRFKHPVLDMAPFWSSTDGCDSLPGSYVSESRIQCEKSHDYYFQSIARLQRLLKDRRKPNKDLGATEIEAMIQYSEHLVYLVYQQRKMMQQALRCSQELDAAFHLLEDLPGEPDALPELHSLNIDKRMIPPLPPQEEISGWLQIQQQMLTRLSKFVDETMHLFSVAKEKEKSPGLYQVLSEGIKHLEHCRAVISDCHKSTGATFSGVVVYTYTHVSQLLGTFSKIYAIDEYLRQNDALPDSVDLQSIHVTGTTLFDCLPGWLPLSEAFQKAAKLSKSKIDAFAEPQQKLEDNREGSTGDFCKNLERTVELILLWVQNQEGAKDNKQTGVESPDDSIKTIGEWSRDFETTLNSCRIQELCDGLSGLVKLVSSSCDGSWVHNEREHQLDVLYKMARMLRTVSPALSIVRAAFAREILRMVWLHKKVAKLAYITTSLFLGLVRDGFCTQEESEDDGKGGEGGGASFQEEDGTGIGDGEGKKDISDEIEDQEQVEGTQKQQEEQDEDKKDLGEDDAKGMEMDQDFDGEFHDIDENQEQSGSDEEGDDDRLDDEMGQVGNEGDTVDERLWDEEDKKEPEGKDSDEVDNDATAPVEDKSKLDYVDGQDHDNEEEDAEEQKKQQKPQGMDMEGEFPEDENEDGEDEDGENADQQGGFTKPEVPAEEMELPEDLNMDGDDDGGKDDGEESGQEQEEPPVQDGEFPEAENGETKDSKQEEDDDGNPAKQEESPEGGGDNKDEEAQEVKDNQGNDEEPVQDDEEMPQDAHREIDHEAASEDGSDKEEAQDEDPNIVQGEEDETENDGLQGGPQGVPTGADTEADPMGGGEEEGKDRDDDNEEDGKTQDQPEKRGDDQGLQSMEAIPQSGPSTMGPSDGRDGAPAPADLEGKDDASNRQKLGSNPFRGLGDVLERWKANLSVTEEANQKPEDPGEDGNAPENAETPDGGEYQFMADGEQDENAAQTLAPATDEQMEGMDAWDQSKRDDDQEDEEGTVPADDEVAEGMDIEEQKMKETLSGRVPTTASKGANPDPVEDGGEDTGEDKDGGDDKNTEEPMEDSEQAKLDKNANLVMAQFQRASLNDAGVSAVVEDELFGGLSSEQADVIRRRIDQQLQKGGSGVQSGASHDFDDGRKLWHQCQSLTANLAGELAEHLRLILEPTQASRLAGDYRTGKRINMKKVLAYVASQYQKDKIWMRRTKPDKRRYQVLLAIDDSKSMAENGCGVFALESLTLLCRAMARLEVGELGITSFGGAGDVNVLHPLGTPFTDASGPGVVSKMKFSQDNSIEDRPMVELMTGLTHMLDIAQHSHSSGASSLSSQSLHQLVLVIADGRFHEKESLKRLAHDLCERKGVLLTFIVLDNPSNSLLDLSSVTFVDGKPQFSKYLDDFPFPLYIVLRDIAALPRTLADLLRQWFQISAGQ